MTKSSKFDTHQNLIFNHCRTFRRHVFLWIPLFYYTNKNILSLFWRYYTCIFFNKQRLAQWFLLMWGNFKGIHMQIHTEWENRMKYRLFLTDTKSLLSEWKKYSIISTKAKVSNCEGRVSNFVIKHLNNHEECRKRKVGKNLELIIDIYIFLMITERDKAAPASGSLCWEHERVVLARAVQVGILLHRLESARERISVETLPKSWRNWRVDHPPGLLEVTAESSAWIVFSPFPFTLLILSCF